VAVACAGGFQIDFVFVGAINIVFALHKIQTAFLVLLLES